MKKIVFILITILVIFLLLPNDFDRGVLAYRQKNHNEAYKIFEDLAKQNSANAQYNLAFMYQTGQGVIRDTKQAEKWYKMAQRGRAKNAKYYIGVLLEEKD